MSLLEVTPADRAWAYDMLLAAHKIYPHNEAAILAGEWDGTDEVQFIAHHREAVTALNLAALDDDEVVHAIDCNKIDQRKTWDSAVAMCRARIAALLKDNEHDK